MDVNIKAVAPLEHWSQLLRCTICFSYFKEPHTLSCGHTFCRGCLKQMAKLAREDSPEVKVRKLSLPCPTCRHPFPAKPCLTGRASSNIILQQMLELWTKECKLLSSSGVMTVRSISTQASPKSVTHVSLQTILQSRLQTPQRFQQTSVPKSRPKYNPQVRPPFSSPSFPPKRIQNKVLTHLKAHTGTGQNAASNAKHTKKCCPDFNKERTRLKSNPHFSSKSSPSVQCSTFHPQRVSDTLAKESTKTHQSRIGMVSEGNEASEHTENSEPNNQQEQQEQLEQQEQQEQTEHNDEHEVITERVRPLDMYWEAIMMRVQEYFEDIAQDALLENAKHCTFNQSTSGTDAPRTQDPATSTAAETVQFPATPSSRPGSANVSVILSDSEADVSISTIIDTDLTDLSNHSEIFSRPIFRLCRMSLAQLLMVLFWCMYSTIIVSAADVFLPFVMGLSFVFFIAIFAIEG